MLIAVFIGLYSENQEETQQKDMKRFQFGPTGLCKFEPKIKFSFLKN